jgi:hypothetical protein
MRRLAYLPVAAWPLSRERVWPAGVSWWRVMVHFRLDFRLEDSRLLDRGVQGGPLILPMREAAHQGAGV